MKKGRLKAIIVATIIVCQLFAIPAVAETNQNAGPDISGTVQITTDTKHINSETVANNENKKEAKINDNDENNEDDNDSDTKKSSISDIETLNKSLATDTYVVIDARTGEKIIGKNETEKMYPASLTKILTSLLLIENKKMDDILTVSKNASEVGESSINVQENEKISAKDILYATMLHSANDAAYVAGESVSGDAESFAKLMNERAKQAGAESSNFVTPNGLHDKNHYTTAMDLALITKDAIAYEEFREVIKTKEYKMSRTEEDVPMKVSNLNRMLFPVFNGSKSYYNAFSEGGKTGYTKQAGNCLMEVVKKDDSEFIVITLKSSEIYPDTNAIINYVLDNYISTPLINKESISYTLNNTALNLHAKEGITYITNKKTDEEINVKTEIKIDDNIVYPIVKDSKVGTINVYVNDTLYKTTDVLASEDYNVVKITGSSFLKNLIICSLILALAKLIMNLYKKRKKKRENYLKNSDLY